MSILVTALSLMTLVAPSSASEPRVPVATYWGGSAYDSALVAVAPDGTVFLAGTTGRATSARPPLRRDREAAGRTSISRS